MKRALVATLSLSAAFALFVPPTMAGESIATKVVIRDSAPAFHGKLKAAIDDCIVMREVKLIRKKPGKPGKVVGTDGTNGQGKWKITEDQFTLKSGVYFAVAPDLGPCERGKSKKIVVD